MLTNFGNKMLSPNPQNHPTIAECSKDLLSLKLEQLSQNLIEANIRFLSQVKRIPGVSKDLYYLLLTMTVSSDSRKAVVPYDRLSEILRPEIAEIDDLLRDQVYHQDGQKYIIYEDVVKTLHLTEMPQIKMATLICLRQLRDHVNHAHLSKIS